MNGALSHCPNCNKRWPSDMLQGEGCPACTLTETAQEDGLYDCCPECGASLAECHIGDAVCSECRRVMPDARGGVMNLYQWQFGHQPHYVVAASLADAEKTILKKYGFATTIERIDCLGPYVLMAEQEE